MVGFGMVANLFLLYDKSDLLWLRPRRVCGVFGGDVGVDEGFEGDGEFVVGAF